MKKDFSIIYIIPLVVTLLMGCGPSGSSFKINGSFESMKGGELYIYNLTDEYARLDTINVADGQFEYSGETTKDVVPYMLVFPNAVEQVIFVAAGQEISYEVEGNDLRSCTVKGNEENELMNEFRKATASKSPNEVQKIAVEYINKHASSPVAAYLFERYYVQANATGKNTHKLLNTLKKAQPKNDIVMHAEGMLKMTERSSIGKVIADMDISDKNNKKTKLWGKHKDEPTLIIFWATWAADSYDLLWKVRASRRNNNDSIKGRCVCVSLDTELFRFETDIRPDSTNNIEQYCDGLAFESPVIKKLGVAKLPYYIITDEKHKIVATGYNGEKLMDDMKKYLKAKSK
jgi:antitoxin component of MazEF toxin-antitoxin module